MITIARKRLTPMESKSLANMSFAEIVNKLHRPYIVITPKNFEVLVNGVADIYKDSKGNTFTFGKADGGFALMPIRL